MPEYPEEFILKPYRTMFTIRRLEEMVSELAMASEIPITESTIVGAAAGAAMTGMCPVVEIMFQDFLTVCMDQIINQAAKMRFMTGGQVTMPIVISSPGCFLMSSAAQRSQSLEDIFMHIPGLKICVASNPTDFKGLLKTAIRDDNPVLFF
ncbi:MAG: hypothetical protein SWK76_07240 [Actinomycetota bacterium]|nr:hypothetical protein [Actinomycetota bacterium]